VITQCRTPLHRLTETLPALQHDPNRPEDVLKVDAHESGLGGDDAADAIRYLVATKPRTVAVELRPRYAEEILPCAVRGRRDVDE
jgi:hypothetical protein